MVFLYLTIKVKLVAGAVYVICPAIVKVTTPLAPDICCGPAGENVNVGPVVQA